MAPLRSLVATSLLLLSTASAHFVLINPKSLEGNTIDDGKLANGPCGAKTPDLAKDEATDFHVDGDFINVRLTHPQATWLFRATVEDTSKNNWTAIFPQVQQTGLGQFCEPAVTAPKEWVGKKGVIGVACQGEDGLLFQCAVVNFVSGTNEARSACANASSVTGDFVSLPELSALVGEGTDDSNSSPSSAPTPTSSPSGSSAAKLMSSGFTLGSLVTVAGMVLAGTVLL
ncbi:hypothetical protein V8F20_005133 [Naviculisporaceae sp. PSN 640]